MRNDRYRARKREQGLCVNCGQEPATDMDFGLRCRQRRRERLRRWRVSRKALADLGQVQE